MRENWGSRFGFIMATAGYAVGLGNIWRFSYTVGENGGGAFLIVYIGCAMLIGIPLLTAELSLGRKTRLTPIAGMEKLTGSPRSPWASVGWLGSIANVMILSYYYMLMAWIVAYFVQIATGRFAGVPASEIQSTFDTFVATPIPVLGYTLLVTVVIAVLVGRGVQKGVEWVAKFAMPLLFVLLFVLAARSLTFEGAGRGLAWYLTPDFSALNGRTVLAALGQAFFSIGIGMSAAFGFGSYMKRDMDIPGNAAIVVACDTGVAFLAGLVIFPALFAFGIDPDSGARLLFVTMTNLFDRMPVGQLFGGAFFFLLILAGLTSAIAQTEVLVATLCDSLRITRKKSVIISATGLFILTVPNVLSQGPWSHLRVFGMDIFVLVDKISGNFMLVAAALALALYVAVAWGWEGFRDETNVGAGRLKVFASWKPFVMYLIPLAVIIILLGGLGIF
jgi:NSS family neurotransmitter:Na+ symporter